MKKFVTRILLFAYVLFVSGAWAAPGIPDRYHKHLLDIKTPTSRSNNPLKVGGNTSTLTKPLPGRSLKQQSDGNLDPTCMGLAYDDPSSVWDIPTVPVRRVKPHSASSKPESCVEPCPHTMDGTLVAQLINPGLSCPLSSVKFSGGVKIGGDNSSAVACGALGCGVIALGNNAHGKGAGSLSVGKCSCTKVNGSIAVGPSSKVCVGACSIAIGKCALVKLAAGKTSAIVIGPGAKTSCGCCKAGTGVVVIGKCAKVKSGCNSITIGICAITKGGGSVTIGHLASSCGGCRIAIGNHSKANGAVAIAIGGFCAHACANNAVVISPCTGGATGSGAVVLGNRSHGNATCAIVIGDCITVSTNNLAQIGNACSQFTYGGGLVQHNSTKTTAYTLTNHDKSIYACGNTAGFAVTTPASGCLTIGQEWCTTKIDSSVNSITLTAGAGVSLIGVSTGLTTQGKRMHLEVVKSGTIAVGEL